MPPDQMMCRQSEPQDAATVVSWFADRTEVIAWGGEAIPDPLTAEWLSQEIRDVERYHYTLRAADETISGFFSFVPFPSDKRLHLTRVGVSPELRGTGIGKRIVSECIRVAREDGADKITLNVFASNKHAIRLYDRAGFSRPSQPTQNVADPLIQMEFAL